MVNKSLFRSYTLQTQTVTVQTFLGGRGSVFFNLHRTVQTQIIFGVVQNLSMWNYSDENKPVDCIDGKLEQFSRLEFAFQLLSHNQYKLWGKIFKFGDCFSFFFLSSSNIQTRIIFRVVLPKPQCMKLLRQKQTRWHQNCRFCIWLDSVHFSEFAFQLLSFTSDIIYLQIVLLPQKPQKCKTTKR